MTINSSKIIKYIGNKTLRREKKNKGKSGNKSVKDHFWRCIKKPTVWYRIVSRNQNTEELKSVREGNLFHGMNCS